MARPTLPQHAAILLMLLAFVLSACSPVVPPSTSGESPLAEPAGTVPQAIDEQATTAAGIYKAFAPGASSPGLEMTLYLNLDGSLRLVNDYLNEEPPFVEIGTWRAEGDQITITLDGQTRIFTLAASQLTSEDWLGPWYEFGALATGLTPAYETDALEAAAAENDFPGYYKAFSPSASCCGLDQTLLLAFDNRAWLTSNYLNGEAPIVEIGAWEVDESGRVTVTLTGREDGTLYEAPDVLVLAVEEGMLVSVEADASRYGAGLAFYYYPGLALPSMR